VLATKNLEYPAEEGGEQADDAKGEVE